MFRYLTNIIHLLAEKILGAKLCILGELFVLCVCSVYVQMVSNLFLKHSESLSQQGSNFHRNSLVRRHQTNTVSAKFQSSLQDLLDKMERFVVNADFSLCLHGQSYMKVERALRCPLVLHVLLTPKITNECDKTFVIGKIKSTISHALPKQCQ